MNVQERAYQAAVDFMVKMLVEHKDYSIAEIMATWACIGSKEVECRIEPNNTEKLRVELDMDKSKIFYFSTKKVFEDALLISNGQIALF